jgi:hypothetical protein
MEELERRTTEKELAQHSTLCDDDATVPQPAIFIEPKIKDVEKVVAPKQAVRRIIIKPIKK